MGRFMSPDSQDDDTDPEPVPWADYKNPQSLNLYLDVYNNPLSHADSDGHDVGNLGTGNLGETWGQTERYPGTGKPGDRTERYPG